MSEPAWENIPGLLLLSEVHNIFELNSTTAPDTRYRNSIKHICTYIYTYIHTYKMNNIHTVHTCGEEAPRLRNGCHIATGEPIQTMSFHVVVHRGMYCNTDHAIKEGRNICITLMYVCTYVYIFVQVNVWTYIIYMCVFCIFMCVCTRAWYARTYLCMNYVKNRRKIIVDMEILQVNTYECMCIWIY